MYRISPGGRGFKSSSRSIIWFKYCVIMFYRLKVSGRAGSVEVIFGFLTNCGGLSVFHFCKSVDGDIKTLHWHLVLGHNYYTGKCIRRFDGIYAYCLYFIDRMW